MTTYPTVEQVIAAHVRLVDKFGGSAGLRDRGALESALGRPQTGYYSDLVEEAAALWESLSQNHPFIDGNKRVAIAVTAAFLRVNGYRLNFEDVAAYQFMIRLYESNSFRYPALERWLREHTVPATHHQ